MFTVIHDGGTVELSSASLAEAAHMVMRYDGHEFEIRANEDGGFSLWTTRFSRNSRCYRGLTRSMIYSIEDDKTRAEAEIYQKVIDDNAGRWESARTPKPKPIALPPSWRAIPTTIRKVV